MPSAGDSHGASFAYSGPTEKSVRVAASSQVRLEQGWGLSRPRVVCRKIMKCNAETDLVVGEEERKTPGPLWVEKWYVGVNILPSYTFSPLPRLLSLCF